MGIDVTLKTESITEENDIRGEGTFGFRTVAVGQMAGGERDDSSEIECHCTLVFTNLIKIDTHMIISVYSRICRFTTYNTSSIKPSRIKLIK